MRPKMLYVFVVLALVVSMLSAGLTLNPSISVPVQSIDVSDSISLSSDVAPNIGDAIVPADDSSVSAGSGSGSDVSLSDDVRTSIITNDISSGGGISLRDDVLWNGVSCYYDIEITPSNVYVLPGAQIRFTSNIAGVEWSAEEGMIEGEGISIVYTAPTDLGGVSKLDDVVKATKSGCVGKADVHIEADDPSTINIDVPTSLGLNEEVPLIITVKDAYGNPISEKKVEITLSSSSNIRANVRVGTDEGMYVHAVTDDLGMVEGFFASGDVENTYTLTVKSGDVEESITISVSQSSESDTGGAAGGSGGGSSGTRGTGVYVVGVGKNNKTTEETETPSEEPKASVSKIVLVYKDKVYVGSTVEIKVLDSDKNPVENRKIRVVNPNGLEKELTSDSNGVISFVARSEGVYRLYVEGADGYAEITAVKKPEPIAPKEEEKQFDIVAALFGGEVSPLVIVLAIILVIAIGAGIYYMMKNMSEEDEEEVE